MLTPDQKTKLCIECGLCCKCLAIPTLNPYTSEIVQYYNVRGFKTLEENGKVTLWSFSPCQYLTPNGCSIYKNRPDICTLSESIDDNGNCPVRDTINTIIKEL